MFWKQDSRSLKGRSAWPTDSKPSRLSILTLLSTLVALLLNTKVKYFWSLDRREKSSTWRELKAVQLAVQSLAHDPKGYQVACFTDNQNVVSVVSGGSRVTVLSFRDVRVVRYKLHFTRNEIDF